jgi:hypothetical protein
LKRACREGGRTQDKLSRTDTAAISAAELGRRRSLKLGFGMAKMTRLKSFSATEMRHCYQKMLFSIGGAQHTVTLLGVFFDVKTLRLQRELAPRHGGQRRTCTYSVIAIFGIGAIDLRENIDHCLLIKLLQRVFATSLPETLLLPTKSIPGLSSTTKTCKLSQQAENFQHPLKHSQTNLHQANAAVHSSELVHCLPVAWLPLISPQTSHLCVAAALHAPSIPPLQGDLRHLQDIRRRPCVMNLCRLLMEQRCTQEANALRLKLPLERPDHHLSLLQS